jgi:hypothetical protein
MLVARLIVLTITNILLEAGAGLTHRHDWGWAPFHYATFTNNAKVIKLQFASVWM